MMIMIVTMYSFEPLMDTQLLIFTTALRKYSFITPHSQKTSKLPSA